ncbi:nickel ABC transporter permease subunit NikC [Helicobacter sp.]|uniref:nickel ABC transporter permease subunit NikC n=1 Tax=Helicobacter sp. TaxID=218 RepID=UPI0025BB44B8|nr:nickel ABC transporter permease subunit NikC [Helicobacter sp.]MCI5968465.1 nickel ABC transporter permease subunit NikC [Helicobacter sp.]MDY2585250.1 nickel ABC transporter permease subunit NikC [Helicobacter sp.]
MRLRISAFLAISILLVAIFAPFIFPYDPSSGDLDMKLLPPSFEHWLGTDHLGRDILSRLGYGARTSFFSLFAIFALILVTSFSVGMFAGYKGGSIDSILMRICDVFLTFPTFVLSLFLIAFLGVGLENVILAIALTHWAWYARMVRSIVLELRTQKYIQAAKVLGVSEIKILLRYILPNVFVQMVILITLDFGHMLLHIASLSFLGLGVQAPTPEWGVMIQDFSPYVMEHPYLMVYPGLCILISVAIFNTLGEALRDKYSLDSLKVKND